MILIDICMVLAAASSGLVYQHRGGPVVAIAVSGDGSTLASAARGGDIIVWSLTKDTIVRRWNVDARVSAITVSPDGSLLGIGFDHEPAKKSRIELRSILRDEVLIERTLDRGKIREVHFSRDGERWGATDGKNLWVWATTADNQPTFVVPALNAIGDFGFLGDGQLLVADGNRLRLLSASEKTFEFPDVIRGIDIDTAGLYVAVLQATPTGSTNAGRLDVFDRSAWNFKDSQVFDKELPLDIAISKNGRDLFYGGSDSKLWHWNTATGRHQIIGMHNVGIYSIAVNPVGGEVYTGSGSQLRDPPLSVSQNSVKQYRIPGGRVP